MRRELSSRVTFFYRIVVPFIFTSGSIILSLQLVSTQADNFDGFLPALFAIISVGFVLVLAWYLSRAKRVWLDHDALIVKGLFEESRIPLKSIEKVTVTRFWNPEQVKIYFRSPSGEESSIYFYPPIRWFRFWSLHPIAEEIQQLVHLEISPNTPYIALRPPTDWKLVILSCAGIAAFALVLTGFVTNVMKNSEPYQWSLTQVQNNPVVIDRLGSPIEPAWFVTGSMRTSGDAKYAFLKYSVAGPNGEGNVVIKGENVTGVWIYVLAGIDIENDYVNFLGQQ